MATYEFLCKNCDDVIEVRISYEELANAEVICERCQTARVRIFSAPNYHKLNDPVLRSQALQSRSDADTRKIHQERIERIRSGDESVHKTNKNTIVPKYKRPS